MSVFVQIDDQRIELTGDAAEIELARQKALADKFAISQKRLLERAAAKESARAKLKALGLTDDEIAALVG